MWDSLNSTEKYYVFTITLIALVVIVKNLMSKNKLAIWGVNNMLMATILYYGIVGPLLAIYNKETYLRLLNHRPYFETAWLGLLLFMISYLIGYAIIKKPKVSEIGMVEMSDADISKIKKGLYYLFGLGIFCVFLLQGKGIFTSLSFWERNSDKEALYSGGFIGYVINGMNLLMVAVPMIVYLWRKKKLGLVQTMLLLFVAFAVFSAAGFRYRLVLSGFSALSVFYLSVNKRIRILPVALLILGFIAYMGVIEVTRNYGRGLDLSKVQNNSFSDNVLLGFKESAVFMATGLVMEKAGNNFEYIGFDPLIQSIVTPIPRFLWPGKPTGNYLVNIKKSYSMKNDNMGNGQAILNYGEYYMAFGFGGILFFGFFIGLLLSKLNAIGLKHIHNPWMLCFYVLNASYAYVIFSRGYMPQQTMLFFFTVFPAYFMFKRFMKNKIK